MSRGLKNRVKKLEEKAAPEEFEEIKIVNTIPGMFPWLGEKVIRYPKKKKKRT
ncbi:MAG: hypothetical protein WBF13_02185 [Candidatus Zixiibacteriota bacterium]